MIFVSSKQPFIKAWMSLCYSHCIKYYYVRSGHDPELPLIQNLLTYAGQ